MKTNFSLFLLAAVCIFSNLFIGCHSDTKQLELSQLVGTWEDDFDGANPSGKQMVNALNISPKLEIINSNRVRFTFMGHSEVSTPRIDEDKNRIALLWRKQRVDFEYNQTEEPKFTLNVKGKKYDLLKTSDKAVPEVSTPQKVDKNQLSENNLIGAWQVILHTGGKAGDRAEYMEKYSQAVYQFSMNNLLTFSYVDAEKGRVEEKGKYYLQNKTQVNMLFGSKIEIYDCPLYSADVMRLSKKGSSVVITLKRIDLEERRRLWAEEADRLVAAAKKELDFDTYTNTNSFSEKDYHKYRDEIVRNYTAYIKHLDNHSNPIVAKKSKVI